MEHRRRSPSTQRGQNPEATALIFEDREWTYAALDVAVTRAAVRLISSVRPRETGWPPTARTPTPTSSAILACARAGLVHVPINFALTGQELAYLLEQSGSTLVLTDPALRSAVDQLRQETDVEQVLELRGGPGSLLSECQQDGPVPDLDVSVTDTDLVQLLYTSGTTSRPKGAMMTHRALVHEYLSCLVGLDQHTDDNPLHAMPLYHSAQMHVFLMPWLAVGARNTLVETPDPTDILRRIETDPARCLLCCTHPVDGPDPTPRSHRTGPVQPAQGLLRGLDHARTGPGKTPPYPARPGIVQLFRAK